MPTSITSRGEFRAASRRRSTLRVRLPVRFGLALGLALIAGPVVGPPGGPTALAATAIVPSCLARQLSARIVDWQGAAGSRIADVELVNTSFTRCSIRDFPRVQFATNASSRNTDRRVSVSFGKRGR